MYELSIWIQCIILHFKNTQSPPFPAHIQEEHIESSLLLLHQFQNALNTETVAWAVWIWGIHRHHEAVPKVLITMSSIIQQTYRVEQSSKSQITQKRKSCHYLLSLMSFQSCMTFFLLSNTKEGILHIVWSVLFYIMKAAGESHYQTPKRTKKKKKVWLVRLNKMIALLFAENLPLCGRS